MSLQIASPFQQFFDRDGSPLDNGFVYVGVANQNPETNPLTIFFDDALTIPAAQPLRTSNGYIVRNGSPARLYTSQEDFSLTVRDKSSVLVFTVADATSLSNLQAQLASGSGSSLVGYNQGGVDAVDRTVQSRLRDFVSVKDFGAVGDGVTDDTAAFQAFLDALEANDYGTAIAHGTFKITSGLILDNPQTTCILGDCRLVAGAAIDTMLTIKNVFAYNGYWEKLTLTGTGGPSNYAGITCRVGLDLQTCPRFNFGHLSVYNFAFAGVAAYTGNSNMASLGKVTSIDCGSGCTYHPSASLTGSWSNPVNSGSSGSTSQLTQIDVTQLPPSYVTAGTYGPVGQAPYMVRIDGRLYFIYSVDTGNSRLSVYPWLPSTATPGTFEYVYGGAVFLSGSDINVFGIELLDATRCGIGLNSASLYGPNAERIVTQFCGVGITIGQRPTAAGLGGHYDSVYFEGNDEDIIFILGTGISGSASYNYIGAEYALNLGKVYTLSAPRLSSDAISDFFEPLGNTPINYLGRRENYLYGKYPNNNYGSQIDLSPHYESGSLIYYGNTIGVLLGALSSDKNRLFGGDCAKITFIGAGASKDPTGTITFTAPSGWTVNGGATAAFSSFAGPVTFAAFWDIAATNVIVAEI